MLTANGPYRKKIPINVFMTYIGIGNKQLTVIFNYIRDFFYIRFSNVTINVTNRVTNVTKFHENFFQQHDYKCNLNINILCIDNNIIAHLKTPVVIVKQAPI